MKNHVNVLNPQKTVGENLTCLVGGILLVVTSVLIYLWIYSKIDEKGLLFALELIVPISMYVISIVLVLVSLNKENKIIQLIYIFALWISLNSIFIEERVMMAAIIILVSILLFLVIKLLGKLFSTIFTFCTSCFLFVPITQFICTLLDAVNIRVSIYVIIYLGILCYIVIFLRFGVRINRFWLKLMGFDQKQIDEYNNRQLKNQFNLLYLVAFLIINLFFMNNSSNITDCVNNALLTGVCITNVNWGAILWKKKK